MHSANLQNSHSAFNYYGYARRTQAFTRVILMLFLQYGPTFFRCVYTSRGTNLYKAWCIDINLIYHFPLTHNWHEKMGATSESTHIVNNYWKLNFCSPQITKNVNIPIYPHRNYQIVPILTYVPLHWFSWRIYLLRFWLWNHGYR